jgi:hypothetical protein
MNEVVLKTGAYETEVEEDIRVLVWMIFLAELAICFLNFALRSIFLDPEKLDVTNQSMMPHVRTDLEE